MSELTYIGTTKNGKKVFVDLHISHAATHFKDSPNLENAVRNSLKLIDVDGVDVKIDFDTQQIVGDTDLVETGPEDEIVYALRPHRDRYSRFVKNKTASPSSWIVMSFEKINEEEYLLYTAFVGRLTPSFPGGDYLPEQSLQFWSNHALVWGNQEIVPGSETTECPW